jgi:carboxylate-amine ligase
MEVMTTYGPDFNISLPENLRDSIDPEILHQKINYYGPSMVAFSLASPFLNGEPWKIRGSIGKSARTYRRSTLAPLIELHPEENGRMEFKGFDMPWHTEDFHAFFLLWLTLLLDNDLPGRASKSSRIFDLGQVARFGWLAETIQERANKILDTAFQVLPRWGFETKPLFKLRERLLHQMTPADLLIQDYYVFGHIREPLKKLTCLNGEFLKDLNS